MKPIHPKLMVLDNQPNQPGPLMWRAIVRPQAKPLEPMLETEIEARVAMAAGRLDRSVLFVTQVSAEGSKRP